LSKINLHSQNNCQGAGVMVSMIVSSAHGAGVPLTQEQVDIVNIYRVTQGRDKLEFSPGLQFFEYGTNRDGW
jgi:hypothetical protein